MRRLPHSVSMWLRVWCCLPHRVSLWLRVWCCLPHRVWMRVWCCLPHRASVWLRVWCCLPHRVWLRVWSCLPHRVSVWLREWWCLPHRVSVWLRVWCCLPHRVSVWLRVWCCLLHRVSGSGYGVVYPSGCVAQGMVLPTPQGVWLRAWCCLPHSVSVTAFQGLRFRCCSWARGYQSWTREPRHPVHVSNVYATESRTPLVHELSADRFSVGLLLHCSPPTQGQNGGNGQRCVEARHRCAQQPMWKNNTSSFSWDYNQLVIAIA